MPSDNNEIESQHRGIDANGAVGKAFEKMKEPNQHEQACDRIAELSRR
jgi:hypothetical protein